MKTYVRFIVALLALLVDASGQASKNAPLRQTPDTRQSDELSKLRREFIEATNEYKANLEKLRASYEKSVQKAEDELARAQALYSQGLILKSTLDRSAQAVENARQKVSEVTRRIATADKQIADTLLESNVADSLSFDNRNAVPQSDDAVSKVISAAEEHFRRGKFLLEGHRQADARIEFDKAVDSILLSGLDVRASQRLLSFYLDLVERIYRQEVPLLRGTVQPNLSGSINQEKHEPPQIGFREQKFEPSPLDELSKLVLTPEEQTGASDKLGVAPGHKAQSPNCAPTVIKAAQLRGFHLGMPISDVRARLPRLQLPVTDSSGYARVSVRFNRAQPPPAFLKGVMTMVFDFIDGQVSYIGVLYDDSIKWKNLDEFTKQVAISLQLPEPWQGYSFNGEQQRMLQCGKLRFVAAMLRAGRTLSPALFLVDDAGIDKLVARKESALERARKEEEIRRLKKLREEEERRKSFKP